MKHRLIAGVVLLLASSAAADPPGLVDEVEQVARRITALLNRARQMSNSGRMSCLDDKLSRTHAALADARLALQDLRRAPFLRRSVRERLVAIERQVGYCGSSFAGRRPATTRLMTVDPSLTSRFE